MPARLRPIPRSVLAHTSDYDEINGVAGDGQDRVVPGLRRRRAGLPVRPVSRRRKNNAKLDRWVDRLHRRAEVDHAVGVSGRVVGIVVDFPGCAIGTVAVGLVAELPVLDAVVVACAACPRVGRYRSIVMVAPAVGIPDPVSSLLGGTRPVIHRHHGLSARRSDDRHEGVEVRVGNSATLVGIVRRVGQPVIVIGRRATWITEHLQASLRQQPRNLRIRQIGVPGCCVCTHRDA
jgi:hypothetical protein